jgi:hypothetical protein
MEVVMNNFGGYNPGNLPPKPPFQNPNPNQTLWERWKEYLGWRAAKEAEEKRLQEQNQQTANDDVKVTPPTSSETKSLPGSGWHWFFAALRFFVLCFFTLIAGGIVFGATGKVAFAVPVWIIGLFISAIFANKRAR